MTAAPDWLPTIGTDAAATAIGDGLQKLADSGVLRTVSGAAMAEPTLLVAGAVVGTLAKTELVEYSRMADRRLTQFIEEADAHEHAYLVKLARGVSHFLPEGFGDAAIDAARGNPDELRRTVEQYYAEDRTELDEAVQRVLAGDFENFGEELCEAFDTDDLYEAQALFLDFRDVIESRQVQETLEVVLELEGQFSNLDEELARTRSQLRSRFRSLTRRDLRDEGFVRLAPVEFDREIDDPEAAWRAGFDFVHVRRGFATERDGIDGNGTAREELLSALRAGEDRLLVGRAGSGKSTVCKSVACAWYDDPDTGAVFYRESGKGRPFASSGSLVEAVRESDGQTLVVVEDAARADAEGIYEAMADLRGEPVSVLLDARRGDVERFGEPGQLETGAQGKLAEAYRNLTQYPLDGRLSEGEIRAVFERFEAKTGRAVQAAPGRVHEEITQGGDIGQMLFLSYYLPVGGAGGGLLQDVENKYRTITGQTDGGEHWDDITAFDVDLRQDVALTTALLVATGVGNHPELVEALCKKHGRDDETNETIYEISLALEGWFVYPTDDPDAEVPATTHERWAALYLQQEAEAFAEERERRTRRRRRGGRGPNRFHTCLTALYAVADDESCREYLREWYPESPLLGRIDDDPAAFGERVACRTLDLAVDRPALSPLYEFGTDQEISVPSVCDEAALGRVESKKGRVCRTRGLYDQARVHYERRLDLSRERDDREDVAKSVIGLGTVAYSQGDYDAAREYFQRALDLKRKLGNRHGVDAVLNNLGAVAYSQGDYDDAREYIGRSLELRREREDRQGVSDCLNNLGAVADAEGEYDDAWSWYQRSLELRRELGDRHGVATCLMNLGRVARERGEYDEARDALQRSLELSRELGDRPGVANTLENLGGLERLQGNYDEAEEYHQRSLELSRELGDRQGVATSLGCLGNVASGRDDDEAEEYHQRSLELSRALGDRRGVATSLGNLGLVSRHRDEYEDAREYHRRSLERKRELGDRQGVATSLNNLGAVADAEGEYEDAREYHQRSLELSRELDDRQGVARSLYNLGIVARRRGDDEQAREHYQRSLDLERELGNWANVARCLRNLGIVAREREAYERASECFERSVEIRRDLGDRERVADLLDDLGDVARDDGAHDAAREYYTRGVEVERELGNRESVAETLHDIGRISRTVGDYDDAADHYRRSLDQSRELANRGLTVRNLHELGIVAREQGAYEDADERLRRSIELYRDLGDRQGVANALQDLGLVEHGRGNAPKAREYFERSIETKRALEDRSGIADSFEGLGGVALSQNDHEEAADYLERSLERRRELDDGADVATSLRNLAVVSRSRGDHDAARDYFERATERFREVGAEVKAVETVDALVRVCERTDDVGAAIEWCERGRKWADSIDGTELSAKAERFERKRRELASRKTGDD